LAWAIDDALEDPSIRQVLLTGSGGVGKSQLAAAAFHRACGRGAMLVWVPASSRDCVIGTYARAWRILSVQGTGEQTGTAPGGPHVPDEETQADLFLAWLRTTSRPWLVVLDDIDDPVLLDGLWPTGDQGKTIVTTRRRDATVIRPSVRVIQVGGFTPEESEEYLCSRLSPHIGPGTVRGAAAGVGAAAHAEFGLLAAELGYLPLALSQAAAFLIDTGISVPAYRRLLGDHRETLSDLLPPSSPADGYGGTVVSTWRLALDRADGLTSPGQARAMLQLLAMLTPDGAPEAVLLTSAARRWIDDGSKDPTQTSDRAALMALRALHRLNLVTHDRTSGLPSVEVHPLVQRATRESVPEHMRAGLAATVADAIEEVWSSEKVTPELAAALHQNAEMLRKTAGHHLREAATRRILHRITHHPGAASQALSQTMSQAASQLVQQPSWSGDGGAERGHALAQSAIRRDHEDLLP
jgi:hypothetical protein